TSRGVQPPCTKCGQIGPSRHQRRRTVNYAEPLVFLGFCSGWVLLDSGLASTSDLRVGGFYCKIGSRPLAGRHAGKWASLEEALDTQGRTVLVLGPNAGPSATSECDGKRAIRPLLARCARFRDPRCRRLHRD